MKCKTYDLFKFIAQIVLPALATLYVTVAHLWNLPYIKEISGTIMAIDTFLGAVLLISSNNYNKNNLNVVENEVVLDDLSDNKEKEGQK